MKKQFNFEFIGDYNFHSKKTFHAEDKEKALLQADEQLDSFLKITTETIYYKQIHG